MQKHANYEMQDHCERETATERKDGRDGLYVYTMYAAFLIFLVKKYCLKC